MKLTLCFTLLGTMALASVFAGDAGNLIQEDSFDNPEQTRQNWTVPTSAVFRDGQVFSAAPLTLKQLPDEFVAEVKVTLQEPEKSGGFAGMGIDSGKILVLIRPDGLAWLNYRLPDAQKASGKTLKIEGFEFGKPNTVTLIRKQADGKNTFTYQINGIPVGTFEYPALGENAKLYLTTSRITAGFDDFKLSALKKQEQ